MSFFFNTWKKETEKNIYNLFNRKNTKYSKSLKWAGYAHQVFFPHIFILHLIPRIWDYDLQLY